MVLLVAIVAGYAATLLRARLTGRHLKPVALRISWLVFLAVIPQLIVFLVPAVGRQFPEALVSGILVVTQALLVVFAAANIKQQGFWALGIGLVANFLAIVFNGGWMPISPDTVHRILPSLPVDAPIVGHRLGLTKDWVISGSSIQLSWLADRFTLPEWVPYHVAFSVGDIFIAVGVVILLWSMSSSQNKEIK